jgi:predicted RNase H-like HicB family nuclease
MLSDYLHAAARRATYEILPEDGDFYGEIPPCPGVHATGKTLENCRTALLEALEDWILFRVHRHLPLPVIDGIELAVKAEAAS